MKRIPTTDDTPTSPGAKPYVRAKPERKERNVPLTKKMHANFLGELDRTGITLSALARACTCEGKRLTVNVLSIWKSRTFKSVPASTWTKVMAILTELPDAQPQAATIRRGVIEPPLKSKAPYRPWQDDYIKITPHLRRRLQQQFERTGIGSSELIRIAEYPPTGLSVEVINAWKNAQTLSAEAKLFNFTVNLLASLPDKPDSE